MTVYAGIGSRRCCCGGVLFAVIGALVILGALGAAVSYLTGASGGTEMQQNRFDGAYYAAQSGLEYLKFAEKNRDSGNNAIYNDIDAFVQAVNDGSPYSLPGVGKFALELQKVDATSYTVKTLVGSVVYASAQVGNYSLITDGSRTFTEASPPSTPNGATLTGIYAPAANVVIDGASTIEGDVYAKSLVSKMVTIKGDVTTVDDATLNFTTRVSGSLCSGGDASLDQSSVGGDANVQGNLTMKFASSIGGNAFVGGSYSADGEVVIGGDLNVGSTAGGDATIGFHNTYSNDVFAKGNIKFSGTSSSILHNAYSGKTLTLSWGSRVVGTAVAKTISLNSGSVGSSITTTTYPPNIAPKAPTACTQFEDPHPKQGLVAGTVDVISTWAQGKYKRSTPLAPGSYRNVTLAVSEPLTLKAGTYIFNKMNLDWDVTLNLDVSGGDITIFCLGPVTTSKLNVYVSTDGSAWKSMRDVDKSNAAKVYLEAHDNISLGWDADWFGTLFSTKLVSFGGSNDLIGAVAMLGTQNNYAWANNIVYVPSNYAMAHWYD